MSQQRGQTSRWKKDWEELELLGKGAIGSVVEAMNKIDSRIYAVKKIRLKTMQSDTKIFREVNALSRLSHRNILRYYTTWVETYEPSVSGESDSGDASSAEAMTSVPTLAHRNWRRVFWDSLLQRVDEGISEDEAWTLFQQIVDALAHMSTLNILHRDIKLTNIFIDAKGDCKVGDFGLATSSLAAVDPSDVASPAVIMGADMTMEVGTHL